MKAIWRIKLIINGFELPLLLECVESQIRDYLKTEMPDASSYSYNALCDDEVTAAKRLRIKIYMI